MNYQLMADYCSGKTYYMDYSCYIGILALPHVLELHCAVCNLDVFFDDQCSQ